MSLVRWLIRAASGRKATWLVLVFWVVVAAATGSLGNKLNSVENNEAQTWLPAGAQSVKALDVGDAHFGGSGVTYAVVVYARPGGLSAADKAKTTRDRIALAAYADGRVSRVIPAPDGEAALISVPLLSGTNGNKISGEVKQVTQVVRAGAPPGLSVDLTGQAVIAADFSGSFTGVDKKILFVTIIVVAVVLLITYRSPVLWLFPLISVAVAARIADAVVYVLAKSSILLVNGQSGAILVVLVFGVGTDYALLITSRYREELRRHAARHDAMAAALRRSLPAVMASAATVAIALLTLLAAQMNSTRGLGPVAAVGVAAAFLVMVTLLPALLVILGRWVFWPFVPRHDPGSESADPAAQHRMWTRVARLVGRAPRVIWPLTTLVLAALAIGIAGVHTGLTIQQSFTTKPESVIGQQVLAAHFPAGLSAPVDIYAKAPAAARVLAAVRANPEVAGAQPAATAGGWTHITAALKISSDSAAAQRAVQQIRAATAAIPRSDTLVGGPAATTLDTRIAIGHDDRLIIPLILLVVLIVLVILLQALVAPLLLLASVALSFAAALGTASLVFHAIGHPRVDPTLPLFGFLFLVALGVDYTIFLITRAREETMRVGHSLGVSRALVFTGGVITSAGIVLAATFTVLTVLPVVSIRQLGMLVAIGVLLDTFVVRTLLVPALALDIGARIWWPSRLARQSAAQDGGIRSRQPTGRG